MPQPTQHSLIHVLLLWTTILSISQAVFIILFFTAGHRGQSQNNSTETSLRISSTKITPSPPLSDNELLLGKGQMVTYKVTVANSEIKWERKNPSHGVVREDGKDLIINKDGYYFISLQVTLKTCKCSCNGTKESEHTVHLYWNKNILLQGGINANTCSTGLLGKVEELHAGSRLEFKHSCPIEAINETEYLTHLDVIYMLRP